MNGVDTINYLQAYNNLGTQLSWSPLYPDGIPLCAVTFGDLNNDKQVDFLITTFGINHINNGDATGLYAWTLPGSKYVSENFPWPMYAHDRYRTNQYGFVPPDEPVGIHPISSIIPDKFTLYQNFPNPFNPSTNIKFDITSSATDGVRGQKSDVKLVVYDVMGREIETLLKEKLSPGSYRIQFDGSKLTSGVYFYSLETESYRETKKFILLK